MSKKISEKQWKRYIERLYFISRKAGFELQDWVIENGVTDIDSIVEYGFHLATKYGEASAALAAEMYDATAELAGKVVPPAIPAPTPTYAEVAVAVTGTAKSGNPKLIGDSITRLVKVTGVDTTMQNALRDGAEWAWIPIGETCAFCLTLASRGWQEASRKAISRGHAKHIHANCNCTYAVRFNDSMDVEGYEPDTYYNLYASTPGKPADKINAIRRRLYAENSVEINAQKREAYRLRKEREKNSQ